MIEIYIDPRGEVAIENLDELLEQFPRHAERAVASALKSEGYNLKEEMKYAIFRGGPSGHKWEKLQHYSQILTRAKNSRAKLVNFKWVYSDHTEGKKGRLIKLWSKGRKGEERTWKMAKKTENGKKRQIKKWLWQQREQGYDNRERAFRAMQRLAGGIRYKYDEDLSMMSVGFVNKNGEVGQNFARLVKMQAAGFETVVTREFQKKAWALGMRLNSGTRLKVPARPLVEPVFQAEKEKMVQRIQNRFLAKIAEYIAKGE